MRILRKEKGLRPVLPAVILSAAICFMFFLYAPLELYFTNKNEFWFDFYHIAPVMLLVFLITTVLGCLAFGILYRIHERLYQVGLVAGFIAFLASYIQGNFLVKKENGQFARSLAVGKGNYFRLPSQETLTLVTAGSAEVSLETVMVPSNIPFTRAA